MGRYILLTGVLYAAACASTTARANIVFDDIQYWVGTGTNQAAFVVDWNDGINPQSLAWGYRWNGTATGADMLTAVVTTDSDLYAKISTPGGFGVALYGLGYDLDHDGFAISDGTTFTNGLAITGPADGAYSLDPADHYKEGWMSAGYWSYWLSGNGLSWSFASTGMSGRALTNGSWDGWSWAPNFGAEPPSEPVSAVPEPMTAVFFGLGMVIAARRR